MIVPRPMVYGCLLAIAAATAPLAAGELPRLDPAAAGFDPARLATIDGLVQQALAEKKMPGCVVC
ncbi:MAG: hypothetical protein ACKO6E_11490, partial [Planctomycetota bacterium]